MKDVLKAHYMKLSFYLVPKPFLPHQCSRFYPSTLLRTLFPSFSFLDPLINMLCISPILKTLPFLYPNLLPKAKNFLSTALCSQVSWELPSSVSAAPWLYAVLNTALKITDNFCAAKFPGYFSPASGTEGLCPSLKPTPLSALMLIMHSPCYSFLAFILYLYLTYKYWISSSLVQGIFFFLLILLWNLIHSLKQMIYANEAQICISSPELSPPIYPTIYSIPLWTQQTQNDLDLTWFSTSFLAWWMHFSFDMTNIVKFKKAGMPAFENLRQMNHNRFPLGSYSFVNNSNYIKFKNIRNHSAEGILYLWIKIMSPINYILSVLR